MTGQYTGAPSLPGWTLTYSGKVRDMYVPASIEAGQGANVVLLVASDRISAFDHVLPTAIPDKGKILTAMSLWWCERLADIVPNHVVSLDVPEPVRGRAMICRRLEMIPIECVARGYLTGSGLREYRDNGQVCGISLPAGLSEGSRLPQAIFTPAYKAPVGEHDENISFEETVKRIGPRDANRIRRTSLEIYEQAAHIAAARGIIIADTKFEFGRDVEGDDDEILLGDEVLTPDSSRFWDAAEYQVGQAQTSLDKQFIRDWLLSDDCEWDPAGVGSPPELPDEVVERTRERYIAAYERLTGRTFTD